MHKTHLFFGRKICFLDETFSRLHSPIQERHLKMLFGSPWHLTHPLKPTLLDYILNIFISEESEYGLFLLWTDFLKIRHFIWATNLIMRKRSSNNLKKSDTLSLVNPWTRQIKVASGILKNNVEFRFIQFWNHFQPAILFSSLKEVDPARISASWKTIHHFLLSQNFCSISRQCDANSCSKSAENTDFLPISIFKLSSILVSRLVFANFTNQCNVVLGISNIVCALRYPISPDKFVRLI